MSKATKAAPKEGCAVSDFFIQSDPVRPMLNIGCLFDVPNGEYILGEHGESILNGGLPYIEAIGGRGNTYKSTEADFKMMRSLDRYPGIAIPYDTEQSKNQSRLIALTRHMENIKGENLVKSGRIYPTDSRDMLGDEWFDQMKKFLAAREATAPILTTPFLDHNGNPLKMREPTRAMIDSMSMMPTNVTDAIYEGNLIGASGANMEAMKGGAAKTQMLMQLPHVTAKHGLFIIITGHVGDETKIDLYAPSTQKFGHLGQGLKFKGCPEKLSFVSNNCWFNAKATTLLNKNTKMPEFPISPTFPHREGDPDLQEILVKNLRGKNGSSGLPYNIMVSQKEGLLPSLTEFCFIRDWDRYGLEGNLQNYALVLAPDIKLSRTTIREKIDESYRLRRAFEVTSELLQIHQDRKCSEELACSPETLFTDLKAAGYDWDQLLGGTVGYWSFKEHPAPLPFLSTMDLLRMRAGLYKPYWM